MTVNRRPETDPVQKQRILLRAKQVGDEKASVEFNVPRATIRQWRFKANRAGGVEWATMLIRPPPSPLQLFFILRIAAMVAPFTRSTAHSFFPSGAFFDLSAAGSTFLELPPQPASKPTAAMSASSAPITWTRLPRREILIGCT